MTTLTYTSEVPSNFGGSAFYGEPNEIFDGFTIGLSTVSLNEDVSLQIRNNAGGTTAPPAPDNHFYSWTIHGVTLYESDATYTSAAAGSGNWAWPAGSVPDGFSATLLAAGAVSCTITNEAIVPELLTVYTNLVVTKGATVSTGTYDWGKTHWSGATGTTAIAITGHPSSLDVSDPSDPVGTWPNLDKTYLVKAVATNEVGASVPAYFTIQVGEGSSIVEGGTQSIIGSIFGSVVG